MSENLFPQDAAGTSKRRLQGARVAAAWGVEPRSVELRQDYRNRLPKFVNKKTGDCFYPTGDFVIAKGHEFGLSGDLSGSVERAKRNDVDMSSLARLAYCLEYDVQPLADAGVRITAGSRLEWAIQMKAAGFSLGEDLPMAGLRKWFKLDFIDLVRPLYADHFYVLDHEKDRRALDTQRALLTWQWMAKTGAPYLQYARRGPYEAMSALSCIGADAPSPLWGGHKGFEVELHRRFQHLFLTDRTGSPSAQQWMKDHGIELNASKRIPSPWYDGDKGGFEYLSFNFRKTLQTALNLSWMQRICEPLLKVQLNSCHDKARWISAVTLELPHNYQPGSDALFRLVLNYGYPNDGGGWKHVIAAQGADESLWNFVRRWPDAFDEILTIQWDEYPEFSFSTKREVMAK